MSTSDIVDEVLAEGVAQGRLERVCPCCGLDVKEVPSTCENCETEIDGDNVLYRATEMENRTVEVLVS